jgi:hypothetical protein
MGMAISQAMWAHGHSIQAEDPALAVGRAGWAWAGQAPELAGLVASEEV